MVGRRGARSCVASRVVHFFFLLVCFLLHNIFPTRRASSSPCSLLPASILPARQRRVSFPARHRHGAAQQPHPAPRHPVPPLSPFSHLPGSVRTDTSSYPHPPSPSSALHSATPYRSSTPQLCTANNGGATENASHPTASAATTFPTATE